MDNKIIEGLKQKYLCNSKISLSDIRIECDYLQENYPELINIALTEFITNPISCKVCLDYILLINMEKINIINNNIDKILKFALDWDLISLKKKLNDMNKETNYKYNDIISQIKDAVNKKIEKDKDIYIPRAIINAYMAEDIRKYHRELEKNTSRKKLNDIIEVIYLLFKEISEKENTAISSLEILDIGGYNQVLSLGDKIIKIGRNRGQETFHNNPYIIAMAARKELKITERLSIIIEISEKVDTNSQISEEELYQLYKNIRELGLVWTDVKYENVGRLLKDNIVHYKPKEKHIKLMKEQQKIPYPYNITDESLGLLPLKKPTIKFRITNINKFRNKTTLLTRLNQYNKKNIIFKTNKLAFILKKGSIVVIDNDYIFDESDPAILYPPSPLRIKFENRYRIEKIDSMSQTLNHHKK